MAKPVPAAAIGVMPTICCAIGDAWLMIMIPADTFRNSISHSSQNCAVEPADDRAHAEKRDCKREVE
jgi:hypothetical protein